MRALRPSRPFTFPKTRRANQHARRGGPFRALLAAALALSCGGAATTSDAQVASAHGDLDVKRTTRRPVLVMIERDGDPAGAVAMTLRHDQGSVASLTLAHVWGRRLPADAQVTTSDGSVTAVLSVASPSDTSAAVAALLAGVTRPIGKEDRAAVASALAATRRLPAIEGADAAVARCNGELYRTATLPPVTAARAEAWRSSLTLHDVSLAVVGKRDVVAAAVDALDETPRWKAVVPVERALPRVPNTWSVSERAADVATIQLAVQLPSGSHAAAAVEYLERIALLATRVRQWPGSFELRRMEQSPDPADGCFAIELASEANLTPRQAARTSASLEAEVDRALDRLPAKHAPLVSRALGQPVAAEAATIASLAAVQPQGRREEGQWGTVNGVENLTEWAGFSALLEEARKERGGELFDLRLAYERNQAGLGVLLASPCGLGFEASGDSGATAVMLHAAALDAVDSVTVVPWMSAYGSGLFAYSAALAMETERQHAERVAGAVSQGLARRLDGPSVAVAVERLLQTVPSSPEQVELAYLLTGNRPSLLSSRGTTRSLTAITQVGVQAARRAFLAQPLRVAVLAPKSREQAQFVEDELRRNLWPQHRANAECPDAPVAEIAAGHYSVRTDAETAGDAILGLVLAPHPGREAASALAVVAQLLSEPGGWLERYVTPGEDLLGNVELSVLEGTGAAALSFVVTAGPEQEVAPLVEQLRGLIQRLPDVPLGERARVVRAELHLADDVAAQSPAFRARRAWLGDASTAEPTDDDLRRVLAALSVAPQVLVTVRNQ